MHDEDAGDLVLRRRGGGFGGGRPLLGSNVRLESLPPPSLRRQVAPPPLSTTPPKYEVLVGLGGVSPARGAIETYDGCGDGVPPLHQARRRSASDPTSASMASSRTLPRSTSLPALGRGVIQSSAVCPVHCYRGTRRTRHDGHDYHASFGAAPTGRGSSLSRSQSGTLSLPRIVPGF
eukprot:TRINITY_DN23254_c0_g2_i1.p1 TRINITY_DN23254_c0_g2~~TRINITY_DN23254_c0_g2_i1.p1  ORF type:complete len:177 (-),score=23.53 TRINITY_DN23254_c0_g2_i1:54-584(-)